LVDSHCHLDTSEFDADRSAVIERAWSAGLRALVIPGIDLAHCRRAVALAEAHDGIYRAAGIHPNSSGDFNATTESELRELALYPGSTELKSKNPTNKNKVVAYGEIGLDYYWDKVAPARQRVAFERQLELAAELGLPVIIHSRESNDDVAAILSAWVQSTAFAASPLATFCGCVTRL
jgi:TatD DNase family protein